jgi:hypothetical protein
MAFESQATRIAHFQPLAVPGLLQFGKARDIVHLEHKQASGFLDQPEDTGPFQSLADTLKAAALGPAETSEFLAAVATDYDRE